jgi:hypothetical protein
LLPPLHRPGATAPAEKKKSKKGPGKKRADLDSNSDSEGNENDADDTGGAGPRRGPSSAPSAPVSPDQLASHATASAAGVHVRAWRPLCHAAVGMYDVKLARYTITDLQERILSAVGASGPRGLLQSDLAGVMEQDPKSIFYYLKVGFADWFSFP